MRFTRDIRTPADPQDFESLYDRPARPPRDFRVTKDAGNTLCIFEFQDFSGIPERMATVGYRAYFLTSEAVGSSGIGKFSTRRAALNIGRLAASVSASGKGEWIRISAPDLAGKTGYFMAVGVNRRGVESEPTLAYPSPYGTA